MGDTITATIYGDSIMKGTIIDKAYRYRAIMDEALRRLRDRFSVKAENRARFGITIERGYKLLRQDIERGLKSDYALLEFGGNDCNFKWNEISVNPDGAHEPLTKLETFVDTYGAMLGDLKSEGTTPILMTLPPIDAERYLAFLGRNGNDSKRILQFLGDVQMIYRFHESYSNAIAKIAEKTGELIVDVRSYFLDKHNFRDLICIDGLHPTEEGYQLVQAAFADFISTKQLVPA